jgi:hypothetical protein
MIIHKDIETARIRCEDYARELRELQERIGVYEEHEDSCTSVYIMADYYDQDGNKRTYYFN